MKKIYTIILSMCFILLYSTTSFASTINEIEPNNSANEAQTIYRNNENPAQIVNGNYSGQYVTVGKLTDNTDKDWYKVYLPADTSTILGINSTALNGTGIFRIYDENLNLISQISHQKDPSIIGTTPYRVNIPTAGYYYVEVSSTLNGGSYRFHIGGPDYTVDNYTYTAPSAVTLTPTTNSVQATYNLSNIASIPDNAIVYYVSIQGTETNRATNQYRRLRINGDSSWINTSMYTYVTNVPVTNNKLLKSPWVFQLEGTVSKSTGTYRLIPEITFQYIYPVLPQ